MSTHTPGPWCAIVQSDWPHRQDVYVTAQQWGAVANVSIDPSLPHIVETQRANLRLIAAAPDMLAALQMAKHIVANEGTDEQMQQVFAAIEKATGEKA